MEVLEPPAVGFDFPSVTAVIMRFLGWRAPLLPTFGAVCTLNSRGMQENSTAAQVPGPTAERAVKRS